MPSHKNNPMLTLLMIGLSWLGFYACMLVLQLSTGNIAVGSDLDSFARTLQPKAEQALKAGGPLRSSALAEDQMARPNIRGKLLLLMGTNGVVAPLQEKLPRCLGAVSAQEVETIGFFYEPGQVVETGLQQVTTSPVGETTVKREIEGTWSIELIDVAMSKWLGSVRVSRTAWVSSLGLGHDQLSTWNVDERLIEALLDARHLKNGSLIQNRLRMLEWVKLNPSVASAFSTACLWLWEFVKHRQARPTSTARN